MKILRAVTTTSLVLLLVAILAACGGSSAGTASGTPSPNQASASATRAATPTATNPLPTPTPTTPPIPLEGVGVLTSVLCPQDTNCQNITAKFTTTGSFALAWVCYDGNWTGTTSNAMTLTLYNGVGRQIDSLNEACPGYPGTGMIPETEPAGSYSISMTENYAPAAVVVVLGGPGVGAS